MKPKRGAIAICSAGTLGIIVVNEQVLITYPNGGRGLAWTGIHLTDGKVFGHAVKIGDPWSSRNPKVIGYLA